MGILTLVGFVARAAYQVFYISPASMYVSGRGLPGWFVSVLVLVACLLVALLGGAIHWAWGHWEWRRFGVRHGNRSADRKSEG
jgi:hypothetical protein